MSEEMSLCSTHHLLIVTMKNNRKYKWIGLFDVDEYVFIEQNSAYYNDINKYLNSDLFKKTESINLAWKLFNDNNIINVVDKDYSVVKRFTSWKKHPHFKSFTKVLSLDIISDLSPMALVAFIIRFGSLTSLFRLNVCQTE